MGDRAREVILGPVNFLLIGVLGTYTLVWGIWVVNPFWDVFSAAKLYSALKETAPEWFWGGWATLCGIQLTWGVFSRSLVLLRRAVIHLWLHWCVIALMYFIGDWHNTGGITSTMIAVLSAVIYLNVRVNSEDVDV